MLCDFFQPDFIKFQHFADVIQINFPARIYFPLVIGYGSTELLLIKP
jgi:hypothetical protein